MRAGRHRVACLVTRELLILILAIIGAWVFLNHHLLYLQPDAQPIAAPPESYALTAFVLYLFVRAFTLVVTSRPIRIDHETERCPECGQLIEDATPEAAKPLVTVTHTFEARPVRTLLVAEAMPRENPLPVRRRVVRRVARRAEDEA